VTSVVARCDFAHLAKRSTDLDAVADPNWPFQQQNRPTEEIAGDVLQRELASRYAVLRNAATRCQNTSISQRNLCCSRRVYPRVRKLMPQQPRIVRDLPRWPTVRRTVLGIQSVTSRKLATHNSSEAEYVP
jgi:hypothetical protein